MLGRRCSSLVAWDNDEIAGVLPITTIEARFGTVLNSLPFFGSNGGVLVKTEAAEAALLDAFNRRASAASVTTATWISNPFTQVAMPQHDVVDERISQWTDLTDPDPATGLARGMESSAHRTSIRPNPRGLSFAKRRMGSNLSNKCSAPT